MSNWSVRPRIQNADGTYNVRCRQCGRIVSRRLSPVVTTITACAICLGEPSDAVLPQYVQQDPTKPPVPIGDQEEFYMYEEEQEMADSKKPWTVMLKPLFRFFGYGKDEVVPNVEVSKKVAIKKKSGGLFEK